MMHVDNFSQLLPLLALNTFRQATSTTTIVMKTSALSSLLLVSQVSAWTPRVPQKTLRVPTSVSKGPTTSFDPLDLGENTSLLANPKESDIKAVVLSSIALGTPTFASAATAFAPNAVPSALAAFGHYISML
jgi:hypothetical protein